MSDVIVEAWSDSPTHINCTSSPIKPAAPPALPPCRTSYTHKHTQTHKHAHTSADKKEQHTLLLLCINQKLFLDQQQTNNAPANSIAQRPGTAQRLFFLFA